jgi:hypothetical protein
VKPQSWGDIKQQQQSSQQTTRDNHIEPREKQTDKHAQKQTDIQTSMHREQRGRISRQIARIAAFNFTSKF